MAKTFELTAPNGKTYEITAPDSATPAQAFAVLQQQLGSSAQPQPQPERESTLGDYAGDIAVGALSGAARIGRGILSAPKLVGLPPVGGQEFIDTSRQRWDELMKGKSTVDGSQDNRPRSVLAPISEFATEVAGTAGVPGGRVASMLPKALAKPGTAALIEGAGAGALLGEGNWGDVGLGAGTGYAGQKVLGGLGRAISQPAKQTPQAEQLRRMGINVTAGQGSEGATLVKSLEEASQYLPGTANAVRRQRELPYKQVRDIVSHEVQPPLNPLAHGSAPTSPSGGSMDEILSNARRTIGQQYDNVLQGKVFQEDAKMAQELADASLTPKWVLSESQRGALARFINDQLNPGRTAGGWKGEHLSIIRRNFDDAAARSTNAEMAGALREVSDKLLENMARQSPEVGQVFQALATPYKNLRTAEEAARHAVSQGEFGVGDLARSAANTNNPKLRDLGRLAATALKDDLSRGGTGLRTALGLAGIGAGYGVGGAAGAGTTAAVPTALYLMLGTRAGQKALSGQFKSQQALAKLLRQVPDAGSTTGAVAGMNTFGD